jgi:hypothetical protein
MVLNFIQTIVYNLPPYIAKYPSDDQQLLEEFRKLIEVCCSKARLPRVAINKEIEIYLNRCRNSDQLITLPFLWFSERFATTANLMLSISSYHFEEFFEYLLKILRGDSETNGVFPLVKVTTPLRYYSWEQLQYASVRTFPLSSDDVDILENISKSILHSGIDILNKSKIKKFVSKTNLTDKEFNITRFFKLLDSQWYLFYNASSFGLQNLVFRFRLPKKDKEPLQLSEIIDIHNPNNTTLAYSRIFVATGDGNEYLGLFRVPTRAVENLKEFLQRLNSEHQIELKEISLVTNQQISTSMNYYNAGKGWKDITKAQWKKIASSMLISNPRRIETELNFFITPLFEPWSYQQHKLASKFISLYCNSPASFSYEELPINPKHDHNYFSYSQTEIGLIKLLLKKKALKISFIPNQLHLEYSLDYYWLTLPQISYSLLSRFLEILPYCRIIYTKSKIHLLTLLRPKLAKWIELDTDWKIIPVNPFYYPDNPQIDWYDFDTHQWRIPEEIKDIG